MVSVAWQDLSSCRYAKCLMCYAEVLFPCVGNILVTRFCVGSFCWFLFLFLRIANFSPFIDSCSKITCFIAVAGIGGAVAVVISREYFDYFSLLFEMECCNFVKRILSINHVNIAGVFLIFFY